MSRAATTETTQATKAQDQAARANEPATTGAGGAGAAQAWKGYVKAVQAKGGNVKGANAEARAAEGVKGAGQALPHGETIQKAFGKHDISGVKAHVGGDAAKAADGLGAQAFATGQDVAFAGSPDLHTAAHEAAHVVQQRGGVQLKGGVGQAGDQHEQHADAVADRVAQGKSAEDLLDQRATAGATQKNAGVQKKEKKAVSGKASGRLDKARKAIAHTKSILNFGAGNQVEALQKTNMNSYYRLLVMRTPQCWELAPDVRPIAAQNPDALTAAKADLAHGGNCGEHAQIAFDYLRVTAVGEKINRADKEGLDHAFVILGDIAGEPDNALVVSDPWPTAATATLWEDHFAYTPDRAQINTRNSITADGQSAKEVIARGLRLSAYGKQMIEMAASKEETKRKTDDYQANHFWQHSNAAARGKDYDYQGPQQGQRDQQRPQR